MLCGSVLPASPPSLQERSSASLIGREQDLDEVLVSGARHTRKASEVIAWMRRLTGQFVYEGHVDLRGQDNPEDQRPVRGGAICVGFGPASGVQCEIRVTWPEARGENGAPMLGGV